MHSLSSGVSVAQLFYFGNFDLCLKSATCNHGEWVWHHLWFHVWQIAQWDYYLPLVSELERSRPCWCRVSSDRPRRPVESSSCCHGNSGGREEDFVSAISRDGGTRRIQDTHTHTHTQTGVRWSNNSIKSSCTPNKNTKPQQPIKIGLRL